MHVCFQIYAPPLVCLKVQKYRKINGKRISFDTGHRIGCINDGHSSSPNTIQRGSQRYGGCWISSWTTSPNRSWHTQVKSHCMLYYLSCYFPTCKLPWTSFCVVMFDIHKRCPSSLACHVCAFACLSSQSLKQVTKVPVFNDRYTLCLDHMVMVVLWRQCHHWHLRQIWRLLL